MITQIDTQTIDFLCRKKLTFNQFCMCLLLHEANSNDQANTSRRNIIAEIIRYTAEVGYLTGGTILRPDATTVNELEDLINKGYLKHDNIDKSDPYSLDNYLVTEKFTKNFLDRFDDYAKELWLTYPKQGKVGNGDLFPAKSVDYDEFKDKYVSILKADISVHDINMTNLRAYLRTNKFAEMGIIKYIGSRHWENLQEQNAGRKIRLH